MGASAFGSESIPPLPGAEQEVNALRELLEEQGVTTAIYTNQLATETNLRSIKGELGVLHVATHGYFLDNAASGKKSKPLNTILNRPDLKSGLILADAKSETPEFTEIYDGFFSAYEALNLDVAGMDLVVLSACETGRGELITGESVQGLARAFKIAGAKGVIMSLWKVDDQTTRELMTAFYQSCAAGVDYSTAFRVAKKKIRQHFKHPYYWSAFLFLN